LTSLSGGTGITYNNTTGAISYSGTVYTDASVRALISATAPISYNSTTGVISLTSGNLTEATSSVLTITGGTGAVLGSGTSIQVKQASSSVSGFLSSTDWSTFNGKASALSGTTNYVVKFTSSTGIGNSLIYDDGVGRILINSTTDNNLGDNGNKGFLINSGGAGLFSFISFRTSNSDRGIFRVNDSELMIGTQTTIPMRFETNNVERIRILSTGNVGIGTTAASTALHVAQSNDGNVAITVQNTNASYNSQYRWLNSAGTQTAAITWIQSASSLRFNNNGYDSIEITNAGVIDLKFNTTIGKSIDASSYLNFSENQISRTGNGLFYINADYSGAVSICSGGGNLLLGTATNNGERLYVSGSIRATGTITANSDITLKKNLLKIENALEKVEQINGYTYELKADDSKRHGGVIAQEMEKVFPEIVNTGNDGLMGVEYGNISALLIEAIKEQQTQIKELQALLNK
jgi:hypothetical protein